MFKCDFPKVLKTDIIAFLLSGTHICTSYWNWIVSRRKAWLKYDVFQTGCRRWTVVQQMAFRSRAAQSTPNTLQACQEACWDNAACNGIDYNANANMNQRCYHALTADIASRPDTNFNHYWLDRDCEGKVWFGLVYCCLTALSAQTGYIVPQKYNVYHVGQGTTQPYNWTVKQ